MSKALSSWSGMRKYLEHEMLAPSLISRVRYNCTSYAGMDLDHLFELYIDGALIKRFSYETVNTYFIENGFKSNSDPFGKRQYWDEFFTLLESVPITKRTEYTDEEFCSALEHYRNSSIEQSLSSENPIERMFAILDRRAGKRRLAEIKKSADSMPNWLSEIAETRFEAENI